MKIPIWNHTLQKLIGISLLISGLTPSLTSAGESKPKYGPNALRLVSHHTYLSTHPSPDYWALAPYYVPQQDGRSCSIASVSMLVNAARATRDLTASDELVSQAGMMKKIPSWNSALGASPMSLLKSSIRMNLDVLATQAAESLKFYGVEVASLQVIHVDDQKPTTLAKIHEILVENEKSSRDFILANFIQSEYTGDPEGAVGHIAPVAAYDEKQKSVLILDPDREYYEPYWVPEAVFIKGMATRDEGAKMSRGFVWVKLK